MNPNCFSGGFNPRVLLPYWALARVWGQCPRMSKDLTPAAGRYTMAIRLAEQPGNPLEVKHHWQAERTIVTQLLCAATEQPKHVENV